MNYFIYVPCMCKVKKRCSFLFFFSVSVCCDVFNALHIYDLDLHLFYLHEILTVLKHLMSI